MSTSMGQTGTGASQATSGGGSQHQTSGQGQSGSHMQSGSYSEGPVARTIEQQTAKLPSDTFLWAAIGSIGASALLRMMGKKHASLFVGDWVSPLLLFGVYNKLVKLHGSDRQEAHPGH
ncbi:MAG TPA: hypothetical protein VJ749_00560 [Pyrinomonadaceae bacterium]|nr:hypothetical protein [Pyrinomonadaceae bacterium]